MSGSLSVDTAPLTVPQILAVTTAGTLITPVFIWLLKEGASAAEMECLFFLSAVYANMIGFPAGWLISRLHKGAAHRGPAMKWLTLVAALITASASGCLAGTLLLILVTNIPWSQFSRLFGTSFKLYAFITLVFGVAIAIYDSLRGRLAATELRLRTEELERERTIKLATEARLASLEARVHPHFLFNTLNSISSLIPTHPQRAERLVEQMSALLRFSLDATDDRLVPLEREMKIVRAYLDIEQERLGPRLRYRIEVGEPLLQLVLPPLSIQTLVENSVKFAVAPSREGGEIWVHAERAGGHLCVGVADTGPGFTFESLPAGHGLENLRCRLATLFGDAAELTLARADGWTRVGLKVPCDACVLGG